MLCPGLKCATTVADMMMDISSKARLGVRMMLVFAGARNNEPSDFINGVDVLVTTPSSLLWLVGQAMTNRERCCHWWRRRGQDPSCVVQSGGRDHCVLA